MLNGYCCYHSCGLHADCFEIHLDVLTSIAEFLGIDRPDSEHHLVQIDDQLLARYLLL